MIGRRPGSGLGGVALWAAFASLLGACSLPEPAPTGPLAKTSSSDCVVRRVVDGDTVKLGCAGGTVSARLVGFDTPEVTNPRCREEAALGHEATAYLEERLRTAKMVEVSPVRRWDKYGRALVRLKIDGRDASQIMVSQGLAVYYKGGRRINWCERLVA